MNITKTIFFQTVLFTGLFIFYGASRSYGDTFDVSTWAELNAALAQTSTAREINLLNDITAQANFPTEALTSEILTVNGNGNIIDGNGHSGFYTDMQQLTLNSITMQNFANPAQGGAIRGYQNRLIINIGEGSSFLNNKTTGGNGSGGAIFNYAGVNIGDNVTFDGNIAGGDYGSGGAIDSSNITIGNGVTFSNNKAAGAFGGSGGAITSDTTLTIGDNVTFTGNSATASGGAISFGTGVMTITTNGGTVLFDGNSDSTGANDIALFSYDDGVTIIDTYLYLNVNAGKVIFNGGISTSYSANSYIEKTVGGEVIFGAGANNDNFTGTYTQTAGTTTYYGGVLAGTNNISNSVLNLWQGAAMPAVTINNLNLSAASVNSIDGAVNAFTVSSFGANGANNFAVDIDGAAGTSDSYNLVSSSGAGTINISSFNILTAPTDPVIDLQIFSGDTAGFTFTASPTKVVTPLYIYSVTSLGGGLYELFRSVAAPAINKNAFRGSVASLTAYYNQIMIDGYVFEQDYARKDKYWIKVYGADNKLNFTQDLTARNDMYGLIAGAALADADLGDGWYYKLGVYGAYNGATQKFEATRMTQNGGQFGLAEAVDKENFAARLLVYAGAYENNMTVGGVTDIAPNWFAGIALKNTYDIAAAENFTIRPGAALYYNFFGRQNWHSDYGNMAMVSGGLSGLTAAPAVDFVYDMKKWSAYLTAKYFFNLNDGVNGSAGTTNLPDIHINTGYAELGLGASKMFTDRFSSYAQIVAQAGDLRGIGLNAGVAWRF